MCISEIYDTTKKLTDLGAFANAVAATVPLTKAMGVSFTKYDGLNLRLDAPLEPNVNDKNTGFGGSIASLATLCGWSLLSLVAHEVSENNIIFIGESNMRYLVPTLGDFHTQASLTQDEKQEIVQKINSNKTAKIHLSINVFNEEQCVAIFTGTYFIKPDSMKIGLIKQKNLQ